MDASMVTAIVRHDMAEKVEQKLIDMGIMEAAHTGLRGDGIVSISPVERIYRIRTRAEITGERLWQ